MGWRDSIDKPSKQTIKETHYSGKKKIERSDEHRQKLSIAFRKPQEEVLQKFKKVHGDRYDYSKVEYVGRVQKVIIICKDHGEFLQSPRIHTGGRGCPKCKQRLRKTNVIEQFKKVHGDRYDYSKVEYVGAHQQVIIICPEHGEFLQRPNYHKNGSDCPKCSYKHGRTVKRTTSEVIEQFKKVHCDRYDYSKVEYVGASQKVIIICPEHGEFLQRVSSHIRGHNCLKCSRTVKRTTSEVIEQIKKVHGDRYDYSKVEYVERSQKVIISCKDHGDFLQRREDHKNGSGCPKCERNRKIETRTRELVEQFRAVHGDRYDYSKVEYVSKRKTPRVTVICPSHGEVQVGVMGHVRGSHCKKCAQRDRVGSKYKKLSNNL